MSIESREPGSEKEAKTTSLDNFFSAHPELLTQHPELAEALKHIPQNGDSAYTNYHNQEWVGVLEKLQSGHGGKITGSIAPKNPKENWEIHSQERGIRVGYDDGIRWDKERKMFYAPADSD